MIFDFIIAGVTALALKVAPKIAAYSISLIKDELDALFPDFRRSYAQTRKTVNVTAEELSEIDKEIYNNQASVVLSGIKMSFNDNINQVLQQLKARITNIKTHVNSIDYMIEFDFRDIVGNVGEATINVLIVADVK